jgi:hypothetical protein
MKTRLVVLLVLTAACRESPPSTDGPSPDPDPALLELDPASPAPPTLDPAQQHAAEVEALLVTVEALAELHRRHASDCQALAEAIAGFHAEHGAALADAPASVHATIDTDEPLRMRMRIAMESVMSASMACRDDPQFRAATAELFGG